MWAHGMTALLGTWLMAAPSVLEYAGASAALDWMIGPLVASVGVMASWEIMRSFRWVNIVFGICLLFAPWFLDLSPAARWNHFMVGVLIISLASVPGQMKRRMGGGWKSLLPG